ncbi:alpha/beta hydrolase [Cupriavidus basilensis]|uniref:alpha/beta hydrolase n=1 Tax=Cupriavidus basilensis TaxID=68895 RepID=UPI0005BAA9D4|nr:alpha/beta hydrolase [Cupriavidus basilensis]
MDWSQDLPDGIVAVRHLRYGTDRQHSYDVFTANTLRNAPVLVFWHGGGWTNGYKEYVSFLASNVIRLGMVLVAPTYRLAPAHRLPAAFDDAVALLAELPGEPALPGRAFRRGRDRGKWRRCVHRPCARPVSGPRRSEVACRSAASWIFIIRARCRKAWRTGSIPCCWKRPISTR